MLNSHALIFSSSVSSAFSKMTFDSARPSLQASTTARMSRSTRASSLPLSAPMLMTMSISFAPSRIALRASRALISGAAAPSGNPTTAQTLTGVPRSSALRLLDVGRIHAHREEAVGPAPRAHSFSMSAGVASGFSSVWSIIFARSVGATGGGAAPAPPALLLEDLADAVRDALKIVGRQLHAAAGCRRTRHRLPLDIPNHVDTPAVALGRAERRHEHVRDGARLFGRHLPRAERQDVGVVVLAAVAGQRLGVARRRQHARHLVGRHRRADAGPVDDDAEVAGAGRDLPGHRLGEHRVVDGLRARSCRSRRQYAPGRSSA